MNDICTFIKVFCEKVWFWLIISVSSIIALFSNSFFSWLGFKQDNRWIIGIVAICSLSLTIQYICDWRKEYNHKETIKKNITTLPREALKELEDIVKSNKKTLKIKKQTWLEQRRIISHFQLKQIGQYVTFPDYLWDELVKKFNK